MDDLLWPLTLLALILAYRAGRRAKRVDRELTKLTARFGALASAAPAPETPAATATVVEAPPAAAEVATPEPAEPTETPVAPAARPAWAISFADLERQITERWAIWLGALATALGGVFLIKYSVDQELLGPGVRVLLGAAFGLALVVGAEIVRQRQRQDLPPYAPAALTAAGIAVLFADAYAAYALYGFIGSGAAFESLAAISAAAVLLSLLHGPLIAQLGLAGGFAVPLLVSTDSPSALRLFLYLAVLVGGCLALIRYTRWWWLAWTALAGAAGWVVLWLGFGMEAGDEAVLAGFVLFLLAAFLAVAGEALEPDAPPRWPTGFADPLAIAGLTAPVAALLLLLPVELRQPIEPAMVAAALLAAAVLLGFARWRRQFEPGAPLGLLFAVLLLGTWPYADAGLPALDGLALAGAGLLLALALSGLGFALLWGAPQPGIWAAIAAAAPNLALAIVFARTGDDLPRSWFGIAGLATAGLALAAAWAVERYRERRGMEIALAAFATGVVAALSLAAGIVLENAWITVALAVQLPAIASIAEATAVRHLRWVAGLLAAIVLVRLLANAEILAYPISPRPVLNWLLYGYGVPLAAFWAASRLFRRSGDDYLVALLEAGALAFGLALVTFEIRHLVTGSLADPGYSLLEQGLQQSTWMAIGLPLLRRGGIGGRPVFAYAWRIVAAISGVHFLLTLLLGNPVVTGEPVGSLPLLNLLLLNYLLPAILATGYVLELRRQGQRFLADLAGLAALVLGLVWISLELRRSFQGPFLTGETGTAETYAYSVAWLAYGAALLAAGLAWSSATLRYASLAVLSLTVLKVFLFDMSELTGLYRAASFIGLGLALVAMGHLYQRFVFAARRAPPQAAPPE